MYMSASRSRRRTLESGASEERLEGEASRIRRARESSFEVLGFELVEICCAVATAHAVAPARERESEPESERARERERERERESERAPERESERVSERESARPRFSTRSFLIRYCEEEVEVNEIGLRC